MAKFILLDIEGTTSPITFVKDVLFPYAYQNIETFILQNQNTELVKSCLQSTQKTILEEQGITAHLTECIAILKQWIIEDRKHTALKQLQGEIWREGYNSKAFTSILYPDVLPALKEWQQKNKHLGVYSSGSIEAQKLFYQHTEQGNIATYFEAWYDTQIGQKKISQSYTNIANDLNHNWKVKANEILFVSDVPEELIAAREAGITAVHIVREGTAPHPEFEPVKSFFDIKAD